jgi:serine phosphatase RsbU (regulator of sigma subunit)
MALAYRNRQTFYADLAEEATGEIASKISEFCQGSALADAYSAFSRMLTEAREKALRKRELDENLTDEIEPVFLDFGFDDGVIRAFGDRRKYIICSGRDADGTAITSPELKALLESKMGMKLSVPEYYRRDDMVLMECESVAKYRLESAVACAVGTSEEISGDSVKVFVSKELFAYGLICDGMGSGKEAKKAADFTGAFLESALGCGIGEVSALHMLNTALRNGDEECSVAVDMFSLDLLSCEAKFIKSAGAASYIKRGNSLFRIKSETMPLGLLKRVDAEKIAVSVKAEDHIIMLSDGVCDPAEDSTWLVELLNRPAERDLNAYAEAILSAARNSSCSTDDMSVLVMRVDLE